MNRNLTHAAVTKRLKPDNAAYKVAAGTGDTLVSNRVDTLGFNAVRVIVMFGTLTATTVVTAFLKGADTSGGASAAITGASVVVADTDDDKMVIIEIFHPKTRFIELAITRATANAVIDGAIIELFLANNEPVTQDATVAQTPVVLNAP